MKPIPGGWVGAAVLLAAAGCETLQPRSVQIDAASGRYNSAQLTYHLDTGRLSQPVQTARIAAQQVSYQQQPSAPLPDRSHARLSVQYPHPRGKAGFALAEVIIEADKTPVKSSSGVDKSTFQRFVGAVSGAMNDIMPGMKYTEGVREAWALEIPKEELDQLVGQLANSGYFAYAPETTPGVEVFTRLDGKVVRKTWRQVPALNDFMERVRHEGQLVSYNGPSNSEGQPADAAGGRNDSVAAFEQQQRRQMQQAAPPSQPFPTNVNFAAQQAQASGQPYPGPGAMHQTPPYMAQRPMDAASYPPAAQPPYGAMPAQYQNAAPPQYGNPGMPQYNNGLPYGGAAAPNYAPAPRPQYGNPPPAQYPSPGMNPPAPSAVQGYPNTSSPPAYPQTGYPQTSQGY